MQLFRTYYFLRTTHTNLKGMHPVVLRIIFLAERRDIFTGVYCNVEHWDKDSPHINNTKLEYLKMNIRLEQFKKDVDDSFNELKFSAKPFFIKDLMEKIRLKDKLPEPISDF